jgi:hypothetical protein
MKVYDPAALAGAPDTFLSEEVTCVVPGGRELRFLRDELLEWLADLPGVRRQAELSQARSER